MSGQHGTGLSFIRKYYKALEQAKKLSEKYPIIGFRRNWLAKISDPKHIEKFFGHQTRHRAPRRTVSRLIAVNTPNWTLHSTKSIRLGNICLISSFLFLSKRHPKALFFSLFFRNDLDAKF